MLRYYQSVLPVAASGDNDFIRYGRLLWRRLWLLLLLPIVAGAATYEVVHKTEAKQYTATASVILQSPITQNLLLSLGGGSGGGSATDSTGTSIQIIESRPIALTVFNEFPDFVSGKHIFPGATASVVPSTNILHIDVTEGHRKEAADVANSYAQAFLQYEDNRITGEEQAAEVALKKELTGIQSQITAINTQVVQAPTETRAAVQAALNGSLQSLTSQQASLSQKITGLQLQPLLGSGGVKVLSQAIAPGVPTSPNPKKDAELVGAGGLFLALAIIILMEMVDDRIRSSSDLARAVPDVPVISSIASGRRRRATAGLAAVDGRGGAVAESYWSLKAVVEHLRTTGQFESILIAGPEGDEGSSTVAANLGVTLAESGTSVLIVDADLRRPSLHEKFGLDNERGLGTVLAEGLDARTLVTKVGSVPGLSVMPAGPEVADAAASLGTGEALALLRGMKSLASVVIITAPPINRFPDAGLLAGVADGVLIVVQKDKTGRSSISESVGTLERVSQPMVGIVVNGSVRVPRGTVVRTLGSTPSDDGHRARPIVIAEPVSAT